AVYGYDLVLPGMLYGKVLFSTRPHAVIKRINTEKAKAYPGVHAVITGEDAPWTHGETIRDTPFLAQGKVRYVGEPVAAVAAGDVEQGFRESDLILEERYAVPAIQHAAMEPHSAHAMVDSAGKVTIWVANDAPFRALHEASEALGLPPEKIRFINPYQGGGFGS